MTQAELFSLVPAALNLFKQFEILMLLMKFKAKGLLGFSYILEPCIC
jgi:hypothetical protein